MKRRSNTTLLTSARSRSRSLFPSAPDAPKIPLARLHNSSPFVPPPKAHIVSSLARSPRPGSKRNVVFGSPGFRRVKAVSAVGTVERPERFLRRLFQAAVEIIKSPNRRRPHFSISTAAVFSTARAQEGWRDRENHSKTAMLLVERGNDRRL